MRPLDRGQTVAWLVFLAVLALILREAVSGVFLLGTAAFLWFTGEKKRRA